MYKLSVYCTKVHLYNCSSNEKPDCKLVVYSKVYFLKYTLKRGSIQLKYRNGTLTSILLVNLYTKHTLKNILLKYTS